MDNTLNTIHVIVAAMLGLVALLAARRALRGNPVLGNPGIPFIVGLLSFMGLATSPSGWTGVILSEYAGLPVAILLLSLGFFRNTRAGKKHEPLKRQEIGKPHNTIGKQPRTNQCAQGEGRNDTHT